MGVPTFASSDFGFQLGGCAARECFAPIATVAAFTAGFLLGKELDDAAARRFVAGPGVELLATRTLELPFVPVRGHTFDGGALFVGSESMVVLEGGSTRTVAGVRGLVDATVVEAQRGILGATSASVFAFPLGPAAAAARAVVSNGGGRIASTDDAVVLSGAGGLRRYSVVPGASGFSLEQDAEVIGRDPAAELLWPRSSEILWTVDGARLVSLAGRTLAEVGALDLPAAPTALDVQGSLALATAGRSGVYVIDVSDPRAPRLAATYRGVRDPRHAALVGSQGYIAAGDQGLVVLDLTQPRAPTVEAVVRNLGRASLVLRGDEHVWVVDEETGEVHRVSR